MADVRKWNFQFKNAETIEMSQRAIYSAPILSKNFMHV